MPAKPPARIFEPRFGRRVIDARAWACLERCRKKLGLDEIPLPVPVEEWIEGPLRIGFGISDLSHLGANVLGAAFVRDREILIDEKVLEHEGRCRFTAAHELGHIMLHRSVAMTFHETAETTLDSPHEVEREADRFAAAFLMPLPLLEREFIRILDGAGLHRSRCTALMMQPVAESEWLWRRRVLPVITRRFDVSLSAAVNRFNDIQARIQDATPLLPFELVERLTRPRPDTRDLDGIEIVNGVPARRDLFTDIEEQTAGG